jgi:signal transduction histidine kinase
LYALDDSYIKESGGYRVNVIQIPRLRLVGFSLVALGILVHNEVFLGEFSWASSARILAVFLGYSFMSWLLLYLAYERVKIFDLGFFFLLFDIAILALAVYYSGGERSYLFFLMMMRVMDHAHTSSRRLLFFTHVSLLTYALLVLYLHFGEQRDLSWGAEGMKAFCIYASSLYIWLTSRRALRNRTMRVLRLTKQLQDKSRQLEEASKAKSLFLANMSHELRTPLNSIIGFANVLLKRTQGHLTPDETSFLERIVVNGKHLLILINDILDFTKLEVATVDLHLRTISLRTLITETVQQIEFKSTLDVALQIDVPDSIADFQADEGKLKQVLINLLSNAFKFTEKGSITVRVVPIPDTNIPGRIDVNDTGIGIPNDRHLAIFEAFQQVENGTTRKYGGTGLGLAISKALCEMMGFRLVMTSEVGVGSTFSIILQ